MSTLSVASPTLTADILTVLSAAGEAEVATSAVNAEILNCTYDEECAAGYIYFRRPPYPISGVHNEAAPIKETLSYLNSHSFNVDIDHEGNVFGVEFLDRGDIVSELRHFGAL